MRLGCLGCLGLVVLILLAVGAGTFAYRVLASPPEHEAGFTAEDGLRAQGKLAEILKRQAGLSSRQDPVVLTEPEINAFLARHLESRHLRLDPLRVRLRPGRVEVSGGLPVDALLQRSPLAGLRPFFPLIVLDRRLWVTVRGRVLVEEGEGEFRLEGWALGRQGLPRWWAGFVPLRRNADLFRWRVPAVVDRVEIGEDRVAIHTRPRLGGGLRPPSEPPPRLRGPSPRSERTGQSASRGSRAPEQRRR